MSTTIAGLFQRVQKKSRTLEHVIMKLCMFFCVMIYSVRVQKHQERPSHKIMHLANLESLLSRSFCLSLKRPGVDLA